MKPWGTRHKTHSVSGGAAFLIPGTVSLEWYLVGHNRTSYLYLRGDCTVPRTRVFATGTSNTALHRVLVYIL